MTLRPTLRCEGQQKTVNNRKQDSSSRAPLEGGGQQWDRKSVSNESLGLLVYYLNLNKKGHCKVLSEIFLIKMSHI